MANFAVPKEKQRVRVVLLGGEQHSGVIFLETLRGEPNLHQKISAFLEDPNEFFPLVEEESAPCFLCKQAIRMVEVEYPSEEASFSLMRIMDVTVVFTDGAELKGSLMADVPPEKARLSDCLNLPLRFLSIRAGTAISFINRSEVRKVVYAAQK